MDNLSLFFNDLRAVVGEKFVITDSAQFAPRLIDNRSRYHGTVSCLVLPAATAEVSAVMRVAARHQANVFVQGGNTSNVGAATPVTEQPSERPSLLLALDRMHAIEEIDTVNDTVTVQTGAILAHVQQAARNAQRLFAVSLAAQGSCTVGGILATNAGGVHVLYYGNSREQCLGLEVVLADGRVLNLMRALRKDNTGYDLKQLFIGSEGTLGVITRARLKLWPLPAERVVALVSLANTEALQTAFSQLQQACSEQLTAFEVMHRDTLVHVSQVWPEVTAGVDLQAPWFALAELSVLRHDVLPQARSHLESALMHLLEQNLALDVIVGQSQAHNDKLWRIRESIPEAHKKTGGNVKHDISVPRNALCAFVQETNALLQKRFAWIKPSVFGHFGDGNLHYNMGVCKGYPPELAFEHEDEIHRIVYAQVARFAGSVAAEHGIGRMKRDLLAQVKSPAEYALLRRIKSVFDPEARLNPGALVLPEPRARHI